MNIKLDAPLQWEPSTHHQVPQPAGKLCADYYEARRPTEEELLYGLAHTKGALDVALTERAQLVTALSALLTQIDRHEPGTVADLLGAIPARMKASCAASRALLKSLTEAK